MPIRVRSSLRASPMQAMACRIPSATLPRQRQRRQRARHLLCYSIPQLLLEHPASNPLLVMLSSSSDRPDAGVPFGAAPKFGGEAAAGRPAPAPGARMAQESAHPLADIGNSYTAPGVSPEPTPSEAEQSRDQFAGLRVQPGQAGRGGAGLDLLDRRRHRVLRLRAPLPERRHAAADGCGARRGDDQLFPLRLSAPESARRAVPADRHRDARRRGSRRTKLVHIGIKGYDIAATERPRAESRAS